MAQTESSDLAVHPSPVLLEAVLKVEQVVARLQNLQSTISGIHLSPVNAKPTRPYRANATSRAKDFNGGKENARPIQRREEDRRQPLKCYNADSKPLQRDTPGKKSKGEWKRWSSPANQVHDVISEILMASEYAKEIATLVAEALQDGPLKPQSPANHVLELKKPISKGGKRISNDTKQRDIAFPSKAQLQKTMSGKLQPSKSVNKFKVLFPSDNIARLNGTPKLSRTVSLGINQNPEKKRESQKLFTSPNGSFRESDYADDELSGPRRLSMNVTEIKSSLKPWKLTPTKGVLFSNPVYVSSPPVKVVPGKKESMRRRSGAASNPLSSSITKVTFKREGAALKPDITKRDSKSRNLSVPLVAPQQNSFLTMLDVLNVKSPLKSSRRLQPVDASNCCFKEKSADRTNGNGEDLQCRVSHSHTKSSVNSESLVNGGHVKSVARVEQGAAVIDSESDKENMPIPRCAPAAVKDLFLRSMSSGHALNRTLSRKNSGVSLLQRAKGWMSSQAVKQGRVRELERPRVQMTTSSRLVVHPKDVHKFKVIFPSYDRLVVKDFRGHKNTVPPVKDQAKSGVNTTVFKVRYPFPCGMKPVIGSSLFPGSVEMFMPGPKEWTDAASTASNRNSEAPSWLQRAIDWTGVFRKQKNSYEISVELLNRSWRKLGVHCWRESG